MLYSLLRFISRLIHYLFGYETSWVLFAFAISVFLLAPLVAIIHIALADLYAPFHQRTFRMRNVALQYSLLIVFFTVCFGILALALGEGVIHASYEFVAGTIGLGTFSFNLAFKFDGISYSFILLTAFINLLCVIYTLYFEETELKRILLLIFITSLCLFHFFLAADIFLLYIYFESVLIPLFLIIGLYGSRERRIHAAYQFFFYTLIGSFLMVLSIIYIHDLIGSTLLSDIKHYAFSFDEEKYLWLAFAFALAVKVPLVPLHVWLPEAHVEAPTIGSVILAAVVLKMGGYGAIRVLLECFPLASIYYQSAVFTVCTLGMIYAALTALRQIDIKKIIAYSSVVHMSYATLGLFCFDELGLSGAILAMLPMDLLVVVYSSLLDVFMIDFNHAIYVITLLWLRLAHDLLSYSFFFSLLMWLFQEPLIFPLN